LTEVGAVPDIQLPAGCSDEGLAIAAPANATNLQRGPRVMSFATASTPAEVVAFYRDAGKTGGWTFTSEPYAEADRGLIEATVAGRSITIVIDGISTGSTVTVLAGE
jgi:hypothetical protein